MPFLHQNLERWAFKSKPRRTGTGHALVQDLPGVPVGRRVDEHNESANQELLDKLYDEVLHGEYRKEVRPMPSCSEVECPVLTEVKLGMRFLQILGLNADDSTLSVQVGLALMWADPRLAFNASKYFKQNSWDSLKDFVSIKSTDIWLPDVGLANTADPHTKIFTDPSAHLYDGSKLQQDRFNVMLLQPAIVRVKCPVDLKFFPMDEQTCQIIFRSPERWLDISSAGSDVHLDATKLYGLVNTKDEYGALSIDVNKTVYNCPDSGNEYPEIIYTVRLKRRTEYYVLNMVLPLQLIALLSVGTLYIPPGENRIFYGVTLIFTLMSVTFFMAPFLPKSGAGNTWLENYEQTVYMVVITPVFFALLTQVYCRIQRQRPGFSDMEEQKLVENIDYVDTVARIFFGCGLGCWVLYMAFQKLMAAMNGEEMNFLPIKVYAWCLAVLILVVIVIDIRGLVSRWNGK